MTSTAPCPSRSPDTGRAPTCVSASWRGPHPPLAGRARAPTSTPSSPPPTGTGSRPRRGDGRVVAAGRRHPDGAGRAPPGAADGRELPRARHRARRRRAHPEPRPTPEEAREFAAKHDGRARRERRAVLLHRPARLRRRRRRAARACPAYSEVHDWELELAVVIGREAFRVDREDALDHVAGYTIVNDVTTRDLVFRKDMKEIGTDWYRAKNAPGFLPTGPFLVPGAVRRPRGHSGAPRAERPGDAGRVDQRPAVRHAALVSAASQTHAAAPRRPAADRQPRRQRAALEAVPARRRRDDRHDRRPRHAGRALRRGGADA